MPEVTKAAASAAEIVCAPVLATRNFMGGTIVLVGYWLFSFLSIIAALVLVGSSDSDFS